MIACGVIGWRWNDHRSVIAKVSESGVNQIESQMGMLSSRQITALCERMDADGTGLIGQAELSKLGFLLETKISQDEIERIVQGVTW